MSVDPLKSNALPLDRVHLSAASHSAHSIQQTMELINRFLVDRSEAEKYATVFHCTLQRDGRLRYVNAGHCAPLVISPDGAPSADQEHGNPGSAAVPEPPQDLLFLGDASVLPQQDRREPRPPSRLREERAPRAGRLHGVTAKGQQVPDTPEDGP